jgi:hypothetical protein
MTAGDVDNVMSGCPERYGQTRRHQSPEQVLSLPGANLPTDLIRQRGSTIVGGNQHSITVAIIGEACLFFGCVSYFLIEGVAAWEKQRSGT